MKIADVKIGQTVVKAYPNLDYTVGRTYTVVGIDGDRVNLGSTKINCKDLEPVEIPYRIDYVKNKKNQLRPMYVRI